MINMRNIKIDTISKTITFEKSVTPFEIKQLIDSLTNYNIIIKEEVKEEFESVKEILKIPEIPDFKPPFNPTCTSPCFCSGKCKTGWSANKSSKFPWNLQDQ